MEATHTQPQIEGGPDVNAFFDSYRMAFDRLDSEDIAKHFTYPMQSTLDTGGAVLAAAAGRSDLRGNLDRLLAMYTYTLAKIEGALRIAALAHNEIPSYREYVSGRLAGGA